MKTPSNGKVARGKGNRSSRAGTRESSERSGRAPKERNETREPRARTQSKLQLPILNTNASPTFGCAQCGLCCTYVAIEVDGPTTVKRATELLWYLYHNGVSLYVNDDSWMVQFETTCRYLTADRRCGVYATRPHICREFSEKECEVNTGDGDGQTFYDATSFMAHLKTAKPRVYALVMKGFAPPTEERVVHPFERRLRDVYVRRAAALQPKAANRTSLPIKKSRGASASRVTSESL